MFTFTGTNTVTRFHFTAPPPSSHKATKNTPHRFLHDEYANYLHPGSNVTLIRL